MCLICLAVVVCGRRQKRVGPAVCGRGCLTGSTSSSCAWVVSESTLFWSVGVKEWVVIKTM